MLQRLRVVYPATKTREELNADALCGGSVVAIRKSLHRLTKRGLIHVVETKGSERGGRPVNVYQAVISLSRGEGGKGGLIDQTTCSSNELAMGQGVDSVDTCPSAEGSGTPSAESEGCPLADSLQGSGSTQMDTPRVYPPVREGRTASELEQIKQASAEAWS